MGAEYVLKTIQPFFVFHASQFYQEIYLKQGISHFYFFQGNDGQAEQIMAVPDGCTDIIFEYGKGEMQAFACGTVLSHQKALKWGGNTYFGIRFQPGILPSFVDVTMTELVGRQLNLKDFRNAKGLLERMEEARDGGFYGLINTFFSEYEKTLFSFRETDSSHVIIEAVKHKMYETAGKVKVSELESYTGYSARYINKIFTAAMGIPPKAYCKIIQFQHTLAHLNQFPNAKLTDVAMDFGYYDQAQLIRDFKQFCSVTPKEYRRLLSLNEYDKHLIDTSHLKRYGKHGSGLDTD